MRSPSEEGDFQRSEKEKALNIIQDFAREK